MIKEKIMISQPMRGKSNEQIRKEREKTIWKLEAGGYEVLDTVLDISNPPEDINTSVYYLAKSIEFLAQADILYMMRGWENARGCRIEYDIAKQYGIKIVSERSE